MRLKSKLNQKTTATQNLKNKFFIDALIRNILKTFRRTVVLTNRLLGRSRPLRGRAKKEASTGGEAFLSVQGLELFYTAKRIAQGGNAQKFYKNLVIVVRAARLRSPSLRREPSRSVFLRSTARFERFPTGFSNVPSVFQPVFRTFRAFPTGFSNVPSVFQPIFEAFSPATFNAKEPILSLLL